MKGKRSKPSMILTSLKDNMRRRNEDDDGDKRKRKKKDESSPSVWSCDLCRYLDTSTQKFCEFEVKILNDKEMCIMKQKGYDNMKVLCNKHYDEKIRFWLKVQNRCIGAMLFGKHEAQKNGKPRSSRVNEVTEILADETAKNTGHIVIPGQKICPQCQDILTQEIKSTIQRNQDYVEEQSVLTSENPVIIEILNNNNNRNNNSNNKNDFFPTDISYDPDEDESDKERLLTPFEKLQNVFKTLELDDLKKDNLTETYIEKRRRDLNTAFLKHIDSKNEIVEVDENEEILLNIKDKWADFTRAQQEAVIQILPRGWSAHQISNVAEIPRERVMNVRSGKVNIQRKEYKSRLSSGTEDKVTQFFLDPSVSRVLPGQNDHISVKPKNGGPRETLQKQILNSALHQAHQKYQEENPENQVSLSQFCKLRPGNVVLMGSSGTHQRCTCVKCQNPKLMISTSEVADLPCFKDLFATEEATVRSKAQLQIDKLLQRINCKCDSDDCRLGLDDNDCEESDTKLIQLKNEIARILEENNLEKINYLQWASSDKDVKKSVTVEASDFPETLIETLKEYRTHKFLHQKFTEFYNKKKEELLPNECIIQMDYSENYKVVNQEEIQSAYYFDTQVSLLGAHVLFCQEDGLRKEKSFVVLSDITKHDTSTVYSCYKKIQSWIQNEVPNLQKTSLITDGCAAQFKNCKQFANTVCHVEDFGHPAEWFFSPTGHGKNSVDGINGTLKHTARLESLRQGDRNTITSAEGFFKFMKEYHTKKGRTHEAMPMMMSAEDLQEIRENETLKQRWAKAVQIKGTHGYHAFLPDEDKGYMRVKHYALSTEYKKVKVLKM